MFVNKYPNTDFHELNLDWLLGQMLQLRTDMKDFINQNVIKYADPIQWNITTQYEANTVVIEPNSGNAYISSQPVPAGVAISNTDYWSAIGNFSLLYESIKESIAAADDGSNINATEARTEGQLLWLNSKLYKVISDISVGALYITSGTGQNLQEVTIEELININTEDIININNNIDAINSSILTMAGQLENITKSLLIVNVEDYGAVGDGITDDTAAIQEAVNAADIIYMDNTYSVTESITIPDNKILKGKGTVICEDYINLFVLGNNDYIEGITFKTGSGLTVYDTVGHIIYGYHIVKATIKNCVFDDIHVGGCIHFDNSHHITVEHNIINGYSFSGIFYINKCDFTSTQFNSIRDGHYTGAQHRYPICVSGYQDVASSASLFVKCNYNSIIETALWEGIDSHGVMYAEFIGNFVSGTERGIVLTSPTSITIPSYNRNIIIENNTIVCSFMGITVAGADDGSSARNIIIKNNSVECSEQNTDTAGYACISLRGHAYYSNVEIAYNRVSGYKKQIAFSAGTPQNVNIHDNIILGRSSTGSTAFYMYDCTNIMGLKIEENYIQGIQTSVDGINAAPTGSLIKYHNNDDNGAYSHATFVTSPKASLSASIKSLGKTGDFIPSTSGSTVAGWLCVSNGTWVAVTSTAA